MEWWGATDDAEDDPLGDGTKGDGLTRYQEYRGFMIGGQHMRTDPTVKDVFVWDVHSLGTGHFGATGLTIRLVNQDEGNNDRVINFNRDPEDGHDQCAIRLIDGEWDPFLFGQCIPGPGLPCECDPVIVYTARIRASYGPNYNVWVTDQQDSEVYQLVIGHELGHAVTVEHHGGGTEDCIMYLWPPPDYGSIPSTYCTQQPEDCLHSFRMH